jgi:hypothetical protein
MDKISLLSNKILLWKFSDNLKENLYYHTFLRHFCISWMNLCLILHQPAQMMSLLWKYILTHKMNAFYSDCTWIHPVTLHTLHYWASLSFNSHDHTRMPLLKAVQDAQTNIALLTVIQGACCFFPSRNTHDSAFACLWKASVVIVWLPFG